MVGSSAAVKLGWLSAAWWSLVATCSTAVWWLSAPATTAAWWLAAG
ncbi:MAG: hypothetical protein ACRDT5_15200 [Mycobacterium sp.]